jgi:NADH dehydrogenase [ubiquinone] 1 alpha subcomplex assembly factor 7
MTPLGERLAERIRREGPISVEAYMAACVAHYYANAEAFGRDGDFITAPEISQMFGELIGLWMTDLWRRAGTPAVDLVELGPGRGTLMADLLRAARRGGMHITAVHLVETSGRLRELQARVVPGACWHDGLASLPRDRALLVVANEFFDALPVRQEVLVDGAWRERCIGVDGDGLVFTPGGGDVRETAPARAAFAADLAARIADQGGAALVIDYGYEPGASNAPRRSTGSLQAVQHHRPVDALTSAGEADLTAHVDFAALAEACTGVRTRLTTQGAFLGSLGIHARAERLSRGLDAERRHAIASAARRLTAPQAMGELFKVLALTHARWPEPEGFTA